MHLPIVANPELERAVDRHVGIALLDVRIPEDVVGVAVAVLTPSGCIY
jgi:hypothetical protein